MHRPLLTVVSIVLGSFMYPAAAAEFSDSIASYVAHDEPRLMIANVGLIDGTGSSRNGRFDISIEHGRIASVKVTGQGAAPAGVVVIDGAGKTVLPGLVMVHEHLFYNDHKKDSRLANYMSEAPTFAALYLAYGVTTARTGGTMNITDDLAIRKMIEAGKALGPKLHLTAPYIEGEGGFAYQMPVPAGTEEVREFVRYWRSQGVESLKAYTQVSREVLGAAIDEGHRLGMHVTGHLCSVTYREAASLGIDNLEHGFGVASDFVADKRPDECPQGIPDSLQATDPNSAEAQSLFRYLVENDVAVTSTMAVFGAGARDYLPSPDALDLMADRTRAGAEKMLEALGPDSDRRASVNASMAHEMALEKAFADAGGTLVVGTDPTGWGGTIPGPGSHAALYLLEEAGFTPLEVIAIATRNGARLLGVEQETGTIEAGKAADLILVDGDPESNLHDLSNVSLVFRDGIAYDSARIIEAMKGQVGR